MPPVSKPYQAVARGRSQEALAEFAAQLDTQTHVPEAVRAGLISAAQAMVTGVLPDAADVRIEANGYVELIEDPNWKAPELPEGEEQPQAPLVLTQERGNCFFKVDLLSTR